MKVKDQWVENERMGDLYSAPPSLPLAPGIEDNIIIAEFAPSMVPDQQPPTDAEEGEVVVSNPPKTIEEPMNEMTYGFMGNHELINLEEDEPIVAVDNDLPT